MEIDRLARSPQRIRFPEEGGMMPEQIASEKEARRFYIAVNRLEELLSRLERVAPSSSSGKFISVKPQAGNCGG